MASDSTLSDKEAKIDQALRAQRDYTRRQISDMISFVQKINAFLADE